MSFPMNSFDTSENVNNIMGFTGPLMKERRHSFNQRSGPMYINRNMSSSLNHPKLYCNKRIPNRKLKDILLLLMKRIIINGNWTAMLAKMNIF